MRRLLIALSLLLTVVPVIASTSMPSPVSAAPAPPYYSGPPLARGSQNQVYTYGLTAGASVVLKDDGTTVATGTVDTQGAYLFRDLPVGTKYTVTSGAFTSGDLTVNAMEDNPTDQWYDDQAAATPLHEGFGYLTTRDGTTLSINVTMPKDGSTGPWPVIVNYSGYDPSQPGDPTREVAVYPYQGYVVVGVNMRGTTCSGGAFWFMENLQATDGYDAIETIARQSWSNGHVGMAGISYSGYSQLYVGATNPPHLDAIAPASPYSDTYSGILYPGGILNNGFAVEWATDRENGAKPAAHTWVRNRINNGDRVCAENQVMRLQSQKLLSQIQSTPFAEQKFSYLNAETFIDKIKMPTYLSAQWQDEQTGGSSANLVPLFDPNTKVYASFTNGVHVEPMAPSEIYEAMVFLDLYVAKRVPHISALLYLGAGGVLADLFGSTNEQRYWLPYNPWPQQPSYEAALATYEAQDPIRIKWENGTVPGMEGEPFSPLVTRLSSWPPSNTTNEKLYLQPDGGLAGVPSTVEDADARAASSYVYDPTTKRKKTFDGGSDAAWTAHPDYHWNVLKEGNSLNYLSDPYTQKAAYAGEGSADLWVRSTAADTDFEVTLTEVRPDGKEVYIQSGWLRGSHRALDPAKSTELVPFHTHQAVDAAPLPAGQFTPIRIEIFPFAHVIRPGSRLRINVEAPGGNQPFWAFEDLPGTATNEVGHSIGMPSRVVLPRLAAADTPAVPDALPPCSLPGVTTQAVSLRNQPCRTYAPARIATAVTAAASDADIDVSWTPPPGGAPDQYVVTPHIAATQPPVVPAGVTDPDAGPSTTTTTAGPEAVPPPVAPDPIVVGGSETSATFAGVTPGLALEFTVTARYAAGDAPASDASLPVAVAVISTTTTSTTTTTSEPTSSSSTSTSSTTTEPGTTSSTSTTSTTTSSTSTSTTTTAPPTTVAPTTMPPTTAAPSTTTTVPTTGTLVPGLFATWAEFTHQVLADFTGAAPDAWVTNDAAALAAGRSPGAYLAAVRRGTDARLNTDPVLRLYRASFGRSPSPSELHHWVGERRKGVSLFAIADAFARSKEFSRRHGRLDDIGFVRFVLTTVGRGTPPPSVQAAWAGLLGHRTLTRGQVLALNTEAPAYKAEAQPWVDVAATWIGLLDRAPTASETTSTVARLTGGTPLRTIMDEILASAEYRNRF